MLLYRSIPILILTVSLGTLLITYGAQYFLDKQPCSLCLYQRIPFMITSIFAFVCLRLDFLSRLIPVIIILCGVVYFIGAGIAIYQVGVEQNWWTAQCSGAFHRNTSLEQLRASLFQKNLKSCGEINWALFGVSMATYNVLFSSSLSFISLATGKMLLKALKVKKVI